MLARSSQWLILSAMVLASASADPATGGAVMVETDLARKSEIAPHKPEHRPPDRIWSGVILATNPVVPKPIPKELREYEASLKRVFGYDQFVIVGTATEAIDEENEHWLLPVHSFSLEFNARRSGSKEARGGYLLNVQIFQDRRPLVAAVAKLAPSSPLFIRGPGCGRGEIIIILQVQH
jgi:hypothetical protein